MSKELSAIENVEISEEKAIGLFTAEDGLKSVVQQVEDHVKGFKHDLSTVTSRKRTASLAAKVAKTKTTLDALGKSLTEDMKNKCKVVDASRKAMRDALDELKQEARKPLTQWEEEEAEKARIAAEIAEAERIKKERDADHELATLMNENFDRERSEAIEAEIARAKADAEKAEQDRIAHEAKLKADAAAQAEKEKQEAILQEKAAKIALEQAEKRAEDQRIKAENDRIEAEKQAKIDAAHAAEQARLNEIRRQEEAAKAEAEEIAQREANKRHVGSIRKAAKEALIEKCGLSEEQAKSVVLAINAKTIPSVKIEY